MWCKSSLLAPQVAEVLQLFSAVCWRGMRYCQHQPARALASGGIRGAAVVSHAFPNLSTMPPEDICRLFSVSVAPPIHLLGRYIIYGTGCLRLPVDCSAGGCSAAASALGSVQKAFCFPKRCGR